MVTGLEILVSSTQFSVALVTRWLQFWTRGGGGVGVVMKVFSAEVDSGDDSTDLDGESNDNLISDNTMPSAASNTRSEKE